MHKWDIKKLSEVYDVRDGTHDSPKYVSEGYPLVTSKNLKKNKVDLSNVKYISQEDYDSINKRSNVEIGDILFAMIGTIGNPVLIEEEPNYAIKNVALFKKKDLEQDPKFLSYYLGFEKTLDKMISEAKGATQKFVGLTYLRNFPIPLPPLPEQQRIVAKLDGLFAKIDKAIGLLEANILHTQALMGSVLDEELSGVNYDLSLWETKTWKDVLNIKNGKNQKAVLNPKGKYPIYGSGGIMNYADDYLCNEKAVIIGRKGTINKPIYVETKFWNVDTAFGLESKDNLLPRFLYFFCIHFNFMTLNKSATLPSLAKRDLLEIEINLPPLKIQKKILKKLEEVNSFKDKIVETQTQKLNHLNALKSSLLDQAFKGEL